MKREYVYVGPDADLRAKRAQDAAIASIRRIAAKRRGSPATIQPICPN